MATAGKIRFGEFTLDLGSQTLQRDGKMTRLTPRLLALLVFLTQNQSDVISKERLLDAVWPDSHVSEGSLSRAIATLRVKLGDDAKEPRYIETVPWTGYRFLPQVSEVAADRGKSVALLICEGTQYPLHDGVNVVGRSGSCDVVIRSQFISRRHARIVIEENQTTIEDLDSRNGTSVDRVPIHGVVALGAQASICLGGADAHFVSGGREGSIEDYLTPWLP